MRFEINGFNQSKACEMVEEVTDKKGKKKVIKIDAADLLILRWFTDFYPNMDKKIIDGKEYGWIKRSKVIEDLPILGISEDSVSERLRKLVHFKLLEYKLVKEKGTFCFYRHGENFIKLVNDTRTGSTQHPSRFDPVPYTGLTQYPIQVQPSNKDNLLNNQLNNFKVIDKNKKYRCSECGGLVSLVRQTGKMKCQECFKEYK